MPDWAMLLLISVIAATDLGAWALFKVARGHSDQALLLLKSEIEASRVEVRQIQADTLASVRQELHRVRTEMAGQMGNMGLGVQ